MDLPESSVRELIQEDDRSKWIAHSNHNIKCFTENEIKRMTSDYKTILGRGSFGEVYQGVLDNRSMVAVKKFTDNVKENFAKELIVHREINHKNVVRLIGYCLDEKALMMVTEYISKGNLSNILHHDSIPIPLDTRLRIALECAEALGYMHSQMYTQVIHGDIKPANILLDDGLRAKVSDFGISRLVNTDNTLYTQHVIGSIGYMDPMFARNGRLTAKSDVYSFGVVLLELITRKKARTEGAEEIGLVESFTQALARGIRRVREMFDADIATPRNMKTLEEIAKLAGKCLRMELDKRPEMLEVAVHLRKLRKAIHQGQERSLLFSWGMKSKSESPASNGSTQKVEIISFGSAETALQLELKDLYQASAHILGRGNFGLTYSLKCPNGDELVAKLRTEDNYSNYYGFILPEAEFERRVTAIGDIQSKHILPLRGYYYYSKDEKVILLYDYMPMGSLARLLHGDRGSGQAPLDWEQRSAISLAVARGVAFIHSLGPSSFHGNIKCSNILLSSTHEAFVSEHGLNTLLDLRLFSWVSLSQESDVYNFGILLIELLARKATLDYRQMGAHLPQWVRSVACEKWAVEVLDAELLGQQYKGGEEECMLQLLQLAIDCCSEIANFRPAMSVLVQRIENIREP